VGTDRGGPRRRGRGGGGADGGGDGAVGDTVRVRHHGSNAGQTLVKYTRGGVRHRWSNTGQALVKHWSPVKHWPSAGQSLAEGWSSAAERSCILQVRGTRSRLPYACVCGQARLGCRVGAADALVYGFFHSNMSNLTEIGRMLAEY
jgi:hypothetical protein